MLCSCKSRPKREQTISQSAFKDLLAQTKFTEEEIQVLRQKFLMVSKNKEFIDKKAFDELNLNSLSKNLSNDLNARIFDCLKNEDKIRFEDYVFFMNNLLHGGLQQKGQLLFKMIDVNQKGSFSFQEFNSFVKELIEFSHYNSMIRSSIKIEHLSEKIYKKFESDLKKEVSFQRFQEVFLTNRKVFDILTYLKNELLIELKGRDKAEEAEKYRLKSQLMFVQNMLKKLNSDLKIFEEQQFANGKLSNRIIGSHFAEKRSFQRFNHESNNGVFEPQMLERSRTHVPETLRNLNASPPNVFMETLSSNNIQFQVNQSKIVNDEVLLEYKSGSMRQIRPSVDPQQVSDYAKAPKSIEPTPSMLPIQKEASVENYSQTAIVNRLPTISSKELHHGPRFNPVWINQRAPAFAPTSEHISPPLPTIDEMHEQVVDKNFLYSSSIGNNKIKTQDFNQNIKQINFRYIQKTISSVIDYITEIKNQLGTDFEDHHNEESLDSILMQSRLQVHRENVPKLVFNDIKSTVFFLHKNWNLVLHMMIGIQLSVLSLAKFQRPLNSYDFNYRGKFDLTPIQGISTNTVQPKEKSFSKCYFHDYAPYVFREIRRLYGIKDDSYLESIGSDHLIKNLINGDLAGFSENISSGKSGSFFYYSRDGKYVLKTIHKNEKNFFLSFIPNYYQHLQSHPESLIVKIFGIHKIIFTKLRAAHRSRKSIRFCIMNNTFDTNFKIDQRYDIKGSLYKREVITNNPQVALKDKNLLITGRKLHLNAADRNKLLMAIKSDVKFFQDNDIIDYSLLLGIHKVTPEDEPFIRYELRNRNRMTLQSLEGSECYYISIIDFFTQYDFKKKSEFFFKSNFLSKDISSIPPRPYGDRFDKFIETNLLDHIEGS